MDVANVRLVAILVGRGEVGRARGLVHRSVAIAVAVSVPFAVLAFLGAPWLAERFTALAGRSPTPAFRAAAVTVPFAALAFTYLGATRGLKIMLYTLYSAVGRAAGRLDRAHGRVLGGRGGDGRRGDRARSARRGGSRSAIGVAGW